MWSANAETILKRVEIDMHRRGWDQPANMGAIIDIEAPGARAYFADQRGRKLSYSTPIVRVGRYLSLPLMPDEVLQPNMAVALHRLAINVTYANDDPRTQQFLDMIRHPGLVAIVACYEGWMTDDPETRERIGRTRERLADIPGSRESRHVDCIDIDLNKRTAMRIRGEAPRLWHATDKVEFTGSAPQDLHAFMCAVLGTPVSELPLRPSLWSAAEEERKREEAESGQSGEPR